MSQRIFHCHVSLPEWEQSLILRAIPFTVQDSTSNERFHVLDKSLQILQVMGFKDDAFSATVHFFVGVLSLINFVWVYCSMNPCEPLEHSAIAWRFLSRILGFKLRSSMVVPYV